MLRVLNVVTKKVDCITNIVNLTLLVMNRQVQHLLLVTRLLFICHMLAIPGASPTWCSIYAKLRRHLRHKVVLEIDIGSLI